jgi:outer membrane protein
MRLTHCLAVFLAAAGVAVAQEPPAAAVKNPKIAVVNMERITAESLLGKSFASQIEALRNEIEAERTKKQAELQKLDAQIKALQDDLQKQASVLSEDAVGRKQQEITKKGRERQAYLEDGQQELQRMTEQAQQKTQLLNNEFQQKMRPYIEAAAKEKNIDILLDSQMALNVSKDFDMTRDVIVKADDGERAAKAKAPAAAAPAAAPKPVQPQAPPAPKP